MKRLRPALLLVVVMALAAVTTVATTGCARSASTDGTSRLRDEGHTTSPAGMTRANAERKSYLWADPP